MKKAKPKEQLQPMDLIGKPDDGQEFAVRINLIVDRDKVDRYLTVKDVEEMFIRELKKCTFTGVIFSVENVTELNYCPF